MLFAASATYAQHPASDDNDGFHSSRAARLYRLGKINKIRELNVHELRVSYGTPSLVDFLSDDLSKYPAGAGVSGTVGSLSLSYKYFLLDNLAVGITGSLGFGNGRAFSTSSYLPVGTFTQHALAIAPEGTLLLNSRKKMMFYYAFALGYGNILRDFSYSSPTTLPGHVHKSFLIANACAGTRFAFSNVIGAFMEVNVGFRGLFNLGLSVKL
jgi:hypothetical protein